MDVRDEAPDWTLTRVVREFADSAVEEKFLAEDLATHRRRYALLSAMVSVIYLAFSITDLATIDSVSVLAAITAGRSLVFIGGMMLAADLRSGRSTLGWLTGMLALETLAMVVFFGTALARPNEPMSHHLSLTAMLLGLLLFLPNRPRRVLPLVIAGVVVYVGWVMPQFDLASEELLTQGASLAAFAVVGMLASVQFGESRRREFATLQNERRSKELLIDEMTQRAELQGALARLANFDELTDVRNRRAFFEDADRELAIARRRQSPISVLVLDVDHFKNVNDTFGHHTGDEVLRRFASLLVNELRTDDLVGRLGGEEFGILMPNAPGELAIRIADRIRVRLCEMVVPHPLGSVAVTASVGVTECRPWVESLHEAMARADMAMYRAKENGRNQVKFAPAAELPGFDRGHVQDSRTGGDSADAR